MDTDIVCKKLEPERICNFIPNFLLMNFRASTFSQIFLRVIIVLFGYTSKKKTGVKNVTT